ncbi:hypothetical protein HPB50_018537 [Hyalomma asiaticum]|uniref:Uncharacterized protein n=1 Tax=Hyalomma asiaticum TaxID=266040 RepID=A0ACB7TM25_HYAAI|nr:hypothetical protein HPB50_018537 [Hyalomma asiaticum]
MLLLRADKGWGRKTTRGHRALARRRGGGIKVDLSRRAKQGQGRDVNKTLLVLTQRYDPIKCILLIHFTTDTELRHPCGGDSSVPRAGCLHSGHRTTGELTAHLESPSLGTGLTSVVAVLHITAVTKCRKCAADKRRQPGSSARSYRAIVSRQQQRKAPTTAIAYASGGRLAPNGTSSNNGRRWTRLVMRKEPGNRAARAGEDTSRRDLLV